MQNKEFKKNIIVALILFVGIIGGLGISYSAKNILANYNSLNESSPLGDTFEGELAAIEVYPISMTLLEGKSNTFSVVAINENLDEFDVTSSSDGKPADESIVEVTGNRITAKKAGTTTVTVTYGVEKRTITVTVQAKAVSVESIALNKTSLSLYVNENERLTATVYPTDATNKAVTWTTSDSNVAYVDQNGYVYAKKKGTALIRAISNENDEIEAFCNVTVNEKTVNVTGVSLDKQNLTLKVDETATLNATVAPSNATNKKVTWKSSNNAVATVNASGVVTAVGYGTATITVTTADGSKTATCQVTVALDYTKLKISAPTPEKLYLALRDDQDNDAENVRIKVTDANGNPVENVEFDITTKGYVDVSVTGYSAANGYVFYTRSKTTPEVTDTIKVCLKGTDICTTYQAYIYCTKWTVINRTKNFELGYSKHEAHLNETCYYRDLDDCEPVYDEEKKTIIRYVCSKYYNRCCGTSGGDTPTYACYKNDSGDYKWSSSKPSGYTKVDGVTSEAACKAPAVENPACYKDANNNYVWGKYANNNAYTLVSGITSEAACKAPSVENPACYKDAKNNYVWGKYANNKDYSLVTNIKDETEFKNTVNVPSTSANVESIIYVIMTISFGFGCYLIYYARKKFN